MLVGRNKYPVDQREKRTESRIARGDVEALHGDIGALHVAVLRVRDDLEERLRIGRGRGDLEREDGNAAGGKEKGNQCASHSDACIAFIEA